MRVRLVGALAAGVQAHMVMGRNGSGRLDVKGVRREERTLLLQPYRSMCHRALSFPTQTFGESVRPWLTIQCYVTCLTSIRRRATTGPRFVRTT